MSSKSKYVLNFQKYDGTKLSNIEAYVKNWLKLWPNGEIMIGCDSQEHPRHIKYSVTINMHMIDENLMGRGGHVVFANIIDHSKNMKMDLYTKLWAEAELSVQAADLLNLEKFKIQIHLDYNSEKENYSNVLYSAGLGYVKGMGYQAFGKPHAPAASYSADAICKNKQGV